MNLRETLETTGDYMLKSVWPIFKWVLAFSLIGTAVTTMMYILNPAAVIPVNGIGSTAYTLGIIALWGLSQHVWQIVSDMLKIRLGAAFQLGVMAMVCVAVNSYVLDGSIIMHAGYIAGSIAMLGALGWIDNIQIAHGDFEQPEKVKNE